MRRESENARHGDPVRPLLCCVVLRLVVLVPDLTHVHLPGYWYTFRGQDEDHAHPLVGLHGVVVHCYAVPTLPPVRLAILIAGQFLTWLIEEPDVFLQQLVNDIILCVRLVQRVLPVAHKSRGVVRRKVPHGLLPRGLSVNLCDGAVN